MSDWPYSYTIRACHQRWQMPVPLREQFDAVVRRIAADPGIGGPRNGSSRVVAVGEVGRVFYQLLQETREVVILELRRGVPGRP